MILYHGTNIDFDQIDLSKSKPNKDFGKGFYLSADLKQAQELAQSRVNFLGGQVVILSYEFDASLLSNGELKVRRFDDYSEEWAQFVLDNRNSRSETNIHDYDIVFGPIANDRVGLQLWKYINQDIDLPTLVKRLKYMKGLSTQYFFGTQRAINCLKRI